MKIRIFGSGIFIGVFEIGCICVVCILKDLRDCCFCILVLVYIDDVIILLDCGLDFRE